MDVHCTSSPFPETLNTQNLARCATCTAWAGWRCWQCVGAQQTGARPIWLHCVIKERLQFFCWLPVPAVKGSVIDIGLRNALVHGGSLGRVTRNESANDAVVVAVFVRCVDVAIASAWLCQVEPYALTLNSKYYVVAAEESLNIFTLIRKLFLEHLGRKWGGELIWLRTCKTLGRGNTKNSPDVRNSHLRIDTTRLAQYRCRRTWNSLQVDNNLRCWICNIFTIHLQWICKKTHRYSHLHWLNWSHPSQA